MFLGESIAGWTFVACFVTAIIVTFASWKRICEDVNQAFGTARKITPYPPLSSSFTKNLGRANILVYSLEVLAQHRQYCLSSPLRRVYAVAAFCSIPAVIGIMVTIR